MVSFVVARQPSGTAVRPTTVVSTLELERQFSFSVVLLNAVSEGRPPTQVVRSRGEAALVSKVFTLQSMAAEAGRATSKKAPTTRRIMSSRRNVISESAK